MARIVREMRLRQKLRYYKWLGGGMDQRVLELLMSRVCHDLISPVGAVVNGVELIEDGGTDMADDAMALVAKSARHASRRLQFFRMAYGAAGAGGDRSLADARQLTMDFLAETKVALDWPDASAGRTEQAGPGGVKLQIGRASCRERV